MYMEYCVEDASVYNEHNLNLFVDKGYLDIARIVYLENIKAFNYAVGENGICDLSAIVGSSNEYNMLQLLDSKKNLSLAILENIGLETEEGLEAQSKLDMFVYSRNVYNQRVNNYLNTYSKSMNQFLLFEYSSPSVFHP